MVAERFDDAVAETLGVGLARLHDTPPQTIRGLEALPPILPSLELLEGLPEGMFFNSSAAELQAWALLQRDTELRRAIESLVARERGAARVPTHCDLRVDQLLLHDGRLYLTDWEEFRLADSARDIGSFAGDNWLLIGSVLSAGRCLDDIDRRYDRLEGPDDDCLRATQDRRRHPAGVPRDAGCRSVGRQRRTRDGRGDASGQEGVRVGRGPGPGRAGPSVRRRRSSPSSTWSKPGAW